jgi:hypothetical protein
MPENELGDARDGSPALRGLCADRRKMQLRSMSSVVEYASPVLPVSIVVGEADGLSLSPEPAHAAEYGCQ